jgi:ubiquinone/menaquinone biosynthesis C-methylase UbiE
MEGQNQNVSQESSFVNPQAVIDQLNITEGSVVADFGCGTGYFVFPIAKKIGGTGIIYALDVLAPKLEAVASQAKLQGLTNVVTKRVNLEKDGGSKLENNSLDWVVLSNMLFQNQFKDIIIKEGVRVMKPGGKMVIIEWKKEGLPMGPEDNLKISKEEVMELGKKAGLTFNNEITVSDFHYGLIFSK